MRESRSSRCRRRCLDRIRRRVHKPNARMKLRATFPAHARLLCPAWKILLLLRNHCGVDFSLYKSSTIQRRIARRTVLNRRDSLAHYADFLRGNSKELDALYSDALISVTSFFRNATYPDVRPARSWRLCRLRVFAIVHSPTR